MLYSLSIASTTSVPLLLKSLGNFSIVPLPSDSTRSIGKNDKNLTARDGHAVCQSRRRSLLFVNWIVLDETCRRGNGSGRVIAMVFTVLGWSSRFLERAIFNRWKKRVLIVVIQATGCCISALSTDVTYFTPEEKRASCPILVGLILILLDQ